MADIVTGLTALKTAFDLAKDIKNASGAYNDAEMRLKFSELYSALSEAKIELADAQLEMYELKRKVDELQGKLNASDELEFRDNVYWRATPVDGKPNGPFCPRCYEGSDKKMSSMSAVTGHATIAGKYKCNSCNAFVR